MSTHRRSRSRAGARSTIRVRDPSKALVYHLVFEGSLRRLTGDMLARHVQGVSDIPASRVALFTESGQPVFGSDTGDALGLHDGSVLTLEIQHQKRVQRQGHADASGSARGSDRAERGGSRASGRRATGRQGGTPDKTDDERWQDGRGSDADPSLSGTSPLSEGGRTYTYSERDNHEADYRSGAGERDGGWYGQQPHRARTPPVPSRMPPTQRVAAPPFALDELTRDPQPPLQQQQQSYGSALGRGGASAYSSSTLATSALSAADERDAFAPTYSAAHGVDDPYERSYADETERRAIFGDEASALHYYNRTEAKDASRAAAPRRARSRLPLEEQPLRRRLDKGNESYTVSPHAAAPQLQQHPLPPPPQQQQQYQRQPPPNRRRPSSSYARTPSASAPGPRTVESVLEGVTPEEQSRMSADELAELLSEREYVWRMEQERFHTERETRLRELQRRQEELAYEAELLERRATYVERHTERERRRLASVRGLWRAEDSLASSTVPRRLLASGSSVAAEPGGSLDGRVPLRQDGYCYGESDNASEGVRADSRESLRAAPLAAGRAATMATPFASQPRPPARGNGAGITVLRTSRMPRGGDSSTEPSFDIEEETAAAYDPRDGSTQPSPVPRRQGGAIRRAVPRTAYGYPPSPHMDAAQQPLSLFYSTMDEGTGERAFRSAYAGSGSGVY